jgi:subtilisin-like proprotein convertase family protein
MRAHLGVGGFLAKVPRLTPARVVALLAAMLGAVVAMGLVAPAASAATFSNTEGITINSSNEVDCPGFVSTAPGTATPYPSEIEVSGLDFLISDVNVTVSGLSHPSPDDIGLLLVSPTGDSTLLMTDSGGVFTNVSGINLTFDDAASGFLPNGASPPLTSGTYKPTVGATTAGCLAPASFPDAPAGPYGSSLSVFNGTDPNGTWQLYVIDDTRDAAGSIDGWSLTFNSPPTAVADSYSTNKDTTLSVGASEGVLANDTDPDGDPITAEVVDDVDNGTLTLSPDGSFTYMPDDDFFGEDSFTYRANDGSLQSEEATTVSINVTAPTTKAQCKKGGWMEFGYPDQGTCISDVNRRNR